MASATETRQTARVKWFNPRSGYGFLTDTSSSEDIFVHHSQITTGANVYKTLTQGEYVEYETTKDDSGKSLASGVTGLNRGPLLCERPQPAFRRNPSQRGGSSGRGGRGRGGFRGGRGRGDRQENAPAESSE